jgi:hypothetical protein
MEGSIVSIDLRLREFFNAPKAVLSCTKEMVEVCAWCPDAHLGTAWARRYFAKDVTHGICPICSFKLRVGLNVGAFEW